MSRLYSGNRREFFDGAFTLRELVRPERAYAIEAEFRPQHRLAKAIFNPSSKPPQHFHVYQTEYIKVEVGKLVVQVEGREHLLTPEDDELSIPSWTYHCLYPPSSATSLSEDERRVTGDIKIVLSSEKTTQPFHEDFIFLENWYHYLNDIVIHDAKLDLIQLLSVSAGLLHFTHDPLVIQLGTYIIPSRLMPPDRTSHFHLGSPSDDIFRGPWAFSLDDI